MAKGGSKSWIWILLFVSGGIFAAVMISMSLFGGEEGVSGITYSVFTVLSDNDGEDVSGKVEIDILVPDDDHTFDDLADVFQTAYFDTEISGSNAEDIEIDLREYVLDSTTDPYGYFGWVIVNEDSDGYDSDLVFNETAFRIDLRTNYEFTIRAYQTPTNVKFSMLCEETDVSGLPHTGATGDAGVVGGQDGNYTLYMNSFYKASDVHGTAPSSDETAYMHYGTGWELSATDFSALTAEAQERYYDETNWRSLGGLYTIANDTAETYGSYLSKHTVVFGIAFEANITIGSTAGYDDINLTASESNLIDTVTLESGNELYMIFLDTVHPGDVFNFEFEFGTDINITDIRACQLYMGDVDTTGIVETEFPYNLDSWTDNT